MVIVGGVGRGVAGGQCEGGCGVVVRCVDSDKALATVSLGAIL